jgi:dipeptidase E
MNEDLLLLSNSSIYGRGYLEHAMSAIQEFLRGRTVHFVPYALQDHDGYTQKVRDALSQVGVEVVGVHTAGDPRAALAEAEVVFVGGGNSFRLAKTLQANGLLEPVRDGVAAGRTSYMGSSAGTNMSCPTLRTTNDMPIVEPSSFETFGLLPFQINPHYLDPDPASTHMGETREERISQFLEENDVVVLGMREGSWLRRRGDSLELGGTTGARLFTREQEPREFEEHDDLSFLLEVTPAFDRQAPLLDRQT